MDTTQEDVCFKAMDIEVWNELDGTRRTAVDGYASVCCDLDL